MECVWAFWLCGRRQAIASGPRRMRRRGPPERGASGPGAPARRARGVPPPGQGHPGRGCPGGRACATAPGRAVAAGFADGQIRRDCGTVSRHCEPIGRKSPPHRITAPRREGRAPRSGCPCGSSAGRTSRSGCGCGRRRGRSRPSPRRCPSLSLISVVTGIDPPPPMNAAGLPHSSLSAPWVFWKTGPPVSKATARPAPCSWNSTRQSAGTRACTNARKAARILCGSWSKTSRNETFAERLGRDHRLEARRPDSRRPCR